MCGIFGWVGKDPKDFNNEKFNILGIFNDERGGHSCGVYHDGEIYAGVYQQKLFRDFIVDNPNFNPGNQPIVIGHTRYATGGSAHTADNAHPFGFGSEQPEHGSLYSFVGVHNGSIIPFSVTELAEKYNIEPNSSKILETGNKMNRKKIDSEILLESIYKSKSFNPLNDYQGAAALIFSKTNEPNVCYFYHGKSYKNASDLNNKHSTPVEERPLFYYQHDKIIYFSSKITRYPS